MSSLSPSMQSTYFSPKKFVRPLRRQLPVFWLVGGVVVVGLICLLIAWRNLSHERLDRDVSIQWSTIERLDKEIAHLRGQIKTESAHHRIAKWAKEQRGWRSTVSLPSTLLISENDLTTRAKQEAALLDTIHD